DARKTIRSETGPTPAWRAEGEKTTAPGRGAAVEAPPPPPPATTTARQLSLARPPVASDRKRPPQARSEPTTPLGLVRQRLAEISGRKIDRASYQTIRDADALAHWVAQATDRGVVAFDLVTTSHDPMIAVLIGVSLALAPNEAAYLPLGHRGANDLLATDGLAADQVPEHEALALLRPMLENAGVLKVGHDLKYDALVLERHGISLTSFDDVMLMSYVLDAGRSGHGLEELSRRHL